MFLFCGLVAYFSGFNSSLPRFVTSLADPQTLLSLYPFMYGGYMVSAVMIGNISDKLIMGYLNDRLGVRVTVIIQLVMVVLGFLFLILFPGSYPLLLFGAFLFGVQNSLYSVSTPLLIRSIFGEKDYTRIFTAARIGTGLIGAFGPPTVGYIFDATGSFVPAFIIGIGVAISCLVVVFVAKIASKKLIWED
jgi:MFS family permease